MGDSGSCSDFRGSSSLEGGFLSQAIVSKKMLGGYLPLVYTRNMKTAKLFQTGRSQAVRLPKEFRFHGSHVYIKKMGPAVVLLPEAYSWDVLFEACEEFSEDFMVDRNEPQTQLRPKLDFD